MRKLIIENGEFEVGEIVRFYDIWNEQGDIDELLESGTVSPDNNHIIAFEVTVFNSDDTGESLVKIVDVY